MGLWNFKEGENNYKGARERLSILQANLICICVWKIYVGTLFFVGIKISFIHAHKSFIHVSYVNVSDKYSLFRAFDEC